MGSRLRKKIGYGLTDLKTQGVEIVDERVNPNSPLLDSDVLDDIYSSSAKAVNSYVNFLREDHKTAAFNQPGLDLTVINDGSHDIQSKLHEIVTHAPEGGLKNVFLITPISGLTYDWYRNDDTMDYIENGFKEDPLTPEVRQLSAGIYPFTTYMDAITGNRLPPYEAQDWIWAKTQTQKLSLEGDFFEFESISQKIGYASSAEALERVVPAVPADVRTICEWGNLFTDPATILELRPLYYRYWA